MKKRLLFIAIACMPVAFYSCKKDKTHNPEVLTASKTTDIQKGEPVLFTLTGAPAGSIVNWSVSPVNTQLNTTNSDTIESILFVESGQYTVTASINNVTIISVVTVVDTSYKSPANPSYNPNFSNFYDTTSLAIGDSLRITPFAKGDSLALTAITNISYSCINNYLDVFNFNYSPLSFFLKYTVAIPKNAGCLGGEKKASSTIWIYIPSDNLPHGISVYINTDNLGGFYSGTVTRSSNGNTYTFTWPGLNISSINTSDVIISPLTVTR